MRTRVQALLISLVVLASTMWLAGCGHYVCQTGFGNTTCGSGGSTSLNQGNGSNSASAFVFAVDQGQTGATAGTIDGYELISSTASSFGPIASFTAPSIPPSDGGMGMAVAQKQFLYVGFDSTLEIFGYAINSTGNLTAISGSPFPATFLSGTPSGMGIDTMITDPAGANLFVADTLSNKIYVFQIGSGGVLTAGTGSPLTLPSGFEPLNMTTDGLGKYLYVTDGIGGTHAGTSVAAYAIGTGGALTAVPGSPFGFPMWQVKGEPTGKFLIGTTGKTVAYTGIDDDNLYVFSIGTTGALTQVTKQSTVYAPFNIAVQRNSGGAQVYSFGINDTQTAFNPIEGYTISGSGGLSADTGSPFSGTGDGSWGQLDESGQLLFVYGSFLNQSTNQITTQIGPVSVGSGGALTQPVGAITIATPGFWTVTDGQ